MKTIDIIIIGGSAAGLTAALTARRHYPDKEILVIRKEEKVSIPCGIPYTFGTVGTPDNNLIPADEMLSKNKIDSILGEVVSIDPESKTISLKDGSAYAYDRLVLATGSLPLMPPIPGSGKGNIFAIRKDVEHLKEIIAALDNAQKLCIVGCGFIGVEIAEECKRRRPELKITIVEMLKHCLQLVYDDDFCVAAEEALKKQDITLMLNSKVAAFEGGPSVEEVRLQDGEAIAADLVIFGLGSLASTALARVAGLKIGPAQGILVNRYMQTSDKSIFACGDCADKTSFFDGKPSNLKLASIATMEGRIAGANLFATHRVNLGVIGAYSTVLGNSTFAAAGLTAAQALERGYEIVTAEAESVNRHPACMPGGAPLKVKLVFETASQVLIGGQVTGAKSGGELINAISVCIHQRMTADNIATLQAGTHPALTASPVAYQLVNAAEIAIGEIRKKARAGASSA